MVNDSARRVALSALDSALDASASLEKRTPRPRAAPRKAAISRGDSGGEPAGTWLHGAGAGDALMRALIRRERVSSETRSTESATSEATGEDSESPRSADADTRPRETPAPTVTRTPIQAETIDALNEAVSAYVAFVRKHPTLPPPHADVRSLAVTGKPDFANIDALNRSLRSVIRLQTVAGAVLQRELDGTAQLAPDTVSIRGQIGDIRAQIKTIETEPAAERVHDHPRHRNARDRLESGRTHTRCNHRRHRRLPRADADRPSHGGRRVGAPSVTLSVGRFGQGAGPISNRCLPSAKSG